MSIINRACSSITELKKSHVIFGSHGDNLCYADVMAQSILQDTTGMYWLDHWSQKSTQKNYRIIWKLMPSQLPLIWNLKPAIWRVIHVFSKLWFSGFSCEGRLSCIRNLGEHIVCGCLTSGQLLIWDTREKTPVLQETECDKSVQWTMDCCETDMVQLSSGGDIQFRDARTPKTCNMTLSNSIGFISKDLEYLKICLKVQ